MSVQEKPPRKSGIAHFFAAAGYSLGGLKRLARESAFRQERPCPDRGRGAEHRA